MDILKKEEMTAYRLRALYESYGYSQFKMSKFEEYDLYVQNKSFLVSDHVITFTDTNGKLMALKPDVTLSIVKNCRQTAGVQKLHYHENVYRVSGGSGAYKEILQSGLECLGEVDAYHISEVLTMAVRSLEEISADYVLEVSHLGIITCVLDKIGLSAAGRQQVLRCVGEKNLHGAMSAAAEDGASPESLEGLKALMSLYGTPAQVLPKLMQILPEEGKVLARELEEILSAVPQQGVQLDFSVIHDMTYYNGIVFRGFVAGVPAGVLSGGQYDRLMQKMGKKEKAVGFAVYMDLLEDLPAGDEAYDVDTVLLYNDACALQDVAAEVRRLAGEGRTVTAVREIPEKLRYRQIMKMEAR